MSRLIILPRPTVDLDHLEQQIRPDDTVLPMTVEGLARPIGSVGTVESLPRR